MRHAIKSGAYDDLTIHLYANKREVYARGHSYDSVICIAFIMDTDTYHNNLRGGICTTQVSNMYNKKLEYYQPPSLTIIHVAHTVDLQENCQQLTPEMLYYI